jgi:anion-transporting  ArsA/GET3 family ATPase
LFWPERLLAHRLIFVMGKGGVGKTTLSVLLGRIASSLGKQTLLVELGDSQAMGEIFSCGTLPAEPRPISNRLWGARVDSKAELEAYMRAHIPSSLIANRITRSRLFEYLFAAAPGLKEVMSLGRIWRWARPDAHDALPRFDLIIVDSPATGHGVSLLQLPGQLVQMIRFGPIASQISKLQSMFQDQEKTCLVLVTLPEELPVNETTELYRAAQSSLHIPVHVVFINRVWPALYTGDDIESIRRATRSFSEHPPETVFKHLLDAANRHIDMRARQEAYISQLMSAIPCAVAEVPFYFTNELSLDDIDRMSREMVSSWIQGKG